MFWQWGIGTPYLLSPREQSSLGATGVDCMCCPFRCGWPGLTSALFEFLGRLLDHAALVTKKKGKEKEEKEKKGRKKKKSLL